ncbi:MAG: 2-oxoacid:acceptor oxidoreductase subunit alpha [Desulfuromonas sp.]|nr:MAG: 2-oxoacid:acceptor oxidoreductase subunit alpha [Desulfuromonas sp.]
MQRYNIVLGGQAGQGVNTVENIIIRMFKLSGYHIYATKEYMSRVRGGLNTITISVGSAPIRSYRQQIDLLIPFTAGVVDWVAQRVTDDTLLLGSDEFLAGSSPSKHIFPLEWDEEIRKEVKGQLNTLCAGMVAALFDIGHEMLVDLVTEAFTDKPQAVLDKNLKAADYGFNQGIQLKEKQQLTFPLTPDNSVKEQNLLNGSEAVAIGALSGGCNALSFYPMSPSTAVAVFLCQQAPNFGLVVEQYEDEIAAAAACIGTWYAGGRGLVTTSGGGFALMEELISLAGMSETPFVLHLAQRPGPATGLPTRTAQGDLNLVLYAGHGDFPRTIYAPRDIEQAVTLSARAFAVADQFQTPAFILTDEYFVDTYYNSDAITLPDEKPLQVIESPADYQRYRITDDGISPRAIPGHGEGVVIANGNEHDEYGDTTEEIGLSSAMPEKRMRKQEQMIAEALEPELVGDEDYSTLVIGWGSTYNTLKDAVETLALSGVALLHFSQIYPLPTSVAASLDKASQLIAVEQNFTGQFADLLQRDYCCQISERILRYDGRALSCEAICTQLEALVKGGRDE